MEEIIEENIERLGQTPLPPFPVLLSHPKATTLGTPLETLGLLKACPRKYQYKMI